MIDKIPLVQKEIIDAVNNENLAVFIGAGVSRIIGCMGWDELAKNLVNKCFLTKKEDGSLCINFKEKESLLQNKNHKKTITICHHILKQNSLEDIFYKELEKSLEADEELLKFQNIYDELYGLRGLFVTTNADEYFDDKFHVQRRVYKKKDFDPSNIDQMKLYHIHGSIMNRNSLIFTVPDYIQRYNDSQFIEFLKTVFNKYTVLFVGYGMAEFELLDFLITKFDSNKEKELKHFILLPFYKGEEDILDFEQSYYNSMGIRVIAFEKDEKGYGQLYEVIKNWNSTINQVSTYLYDSYQKIEDVVNNYEEIRAEKIFQIIKNDKPQENYFFKTLTSCNNPFPWLKPLKEKGYFNPGNNPSPQEVPDKKGFTIPRWNVLGYLENVGKQNTKAPNGVVTKILLDILHSIVNYRNEASERIDNNWTDWFIIKIIFTLPIKDIAKKHIKFIGTALKSKWDTTLVAADIGKIALPKLVNDNAKETVLELLDVILAYQNDNREKTEKYISVMDDIGLNEALKKHKPVIAKLCDIEAAKIAINKIKSIVKEDKSQFNIIWIPTIEDHPQISFPDRYECQLVQFVRDMFVHSEPVKIKEDINTLLKEEHSIFKRIALYIINYHYKELNELFWNWEVNPFDEGFLKHELYELLKNNCTNFSKKQIKNILRWIESKKYYIRDEIKGDKKNIELVTAYKKREWLSALIETKDPDAITSYEKYEKINPVEIDHPGFDFWSEGLVGTISPIEKIELLDKSNVEIAKYFFNYKEERGWKKPSKEGLLDTFRKCVSENPNKFADDMKPFLSVQRSFQYTLLLGLTEAWRANKDFVWDNIFNFIRKIINSVEFWNIKYDERNDNYRNWIISQVANLIEDGTKDDNHAFVAELLPQVEKILLLLVEKTKSDLFEMNDLVTSVLNSPKGQIFSAMINYSLRSARLFKREQEERWVKVIKEDFDKRLNRKVESSLEFSLTLGKYLANLVYLDKKWLIDNINRILLKDNDTHWEAAFIGYLFYSSVVYKDLYFLLRKNGHYTKALQSEFSDTHITERLVQHICIGYLEDWEKLDDNTSLISELIENKNVNQLSAIVSFFWMLRDKLTDKIKAKVKPIWKALFELSSQSKENPEYQKIISNLSKWLSLIDEIDEQSLEWLKLSAKYIQADFNASFFIEYLLKHAPKTPAEVGEIYLEMLNVELYPEYKKENIQEIVRILYKQGQKEKSDIIYNRYAAKGFDFLKTIYEDHRDDNL